MAMAAVSLPTPPPTTGASSRASSFMGDGDCLLDRLVAACQAPSARTADPRLFGRDLQPYDFSAEPASIPMDCAPAPSAQSARACKPGGKSKRAGPKVDVSTSSNPSKNAEAHAAAKRVSKDDRLKDHAAASSGGQASSRRGATPKKQQQDAKRTRTSASKKEQQQASATTPAKGGNGRSGSPNKSSRTPRVAQFAASSPAPGSVHKSSSFAGPGFCNSPCPQTLPLPPPALLLRRI